jgi:hypothetical protein
MGHNLQQLIYPMSAGVARPNRLQSVANQAGGQVGVVDDRAQMLRHLSPMARDQIIGARPE